MFAEGMDRGVFDRALIDLAQPAGAEHPAAVARFVDDEHGDEFLDAVIHHRLQASLVDVLKRSNQPLPDRLMDLVIDDQVTRLRIKQALLAVVDALGDVPWVVLKGPSIAARMKRSELRTYNDLDVLVLGRHLAATVERLERAGFVMLNRNWEPYRRFMVGEIPMAGYGITLDLHWDVIALGQLRRDLELPVEAMVDDAESVRLSGDIDIPVLSPIDQIVQVATHCGLSGAVRLDQLRDLRVVVEAAPDADWDELTQRARSAGVAMLVGHALDRTDRVIGLETGPDAAAGLDGLSLALRRLVDGGDVGSLRRLPVSVWRDTPTAFLRSLRLHGEEWWQHQRGRGRQWDFGDPDSILYFDTVSGGDAGRRHFFDAVAAAPPGGRG